MLTNMSKIKPDSRRMSWLLKERVEFNQLFPSASPAVNDHRIDPECFGGGIPRLGIDKEYFCFSELLLREASILAVLAGKVPQRCGQPIALIRV
jgi:hypothetical protein